MELLVKILSFLQIIISEWKSTEKNEVSLGTTNFFNKGQHSCEFILWESNDLLIAMLK